MQVHTNMKSIGQPAVIIALILVLLTLVVGCAPETGPSGESQTLVLFATSSDVGLGTARIPLSIRMIDGGRLEDMADLLEVTYSPPDSDEVRLARDLKWRAWPIHGGAYTANMTFDQVGFWSIKVRSLKDDSLFSTGSGILVKSSTDAPDIGDSAPLTPTKIILPGGNLRAITSAPDPDPDLYRISFDEAVSTGLPTVISFSTPGYCQSATCGPQIEVLSQLDNAYQGRAHFIHVEIFDNPEEMLENGDPSIGVEAPVVYEWGFHTEPWTFIIDQSGTVVGRFEGFVTGMEIEEYLLPALFGT